MQIEREDKGLDLSRNGGETGAATPKSAATRRAWEVACRAWSRCDHTDNIEAMKLGEAMMYAGTAHICALEDQTVEASR